MAPLLFALLTSFTALANESRVPDATLVFENRFQTIDILATAENVRLEASADAKAHVKLENFQTKNGKVPYTVEITDGTLEVMLRARHTSSLFALLRGDLADDPVGGKVLVQVPAKWHGDINVRTSSGDLAVGAIDPKSLAIKTVSGNVVTDPLLQASALKVDTVSGDVKLYGKLRDLHLGSVSGNLRVFAAPGPAWDVTTRTISGLVKNRLPPTPKGATKVFAKTVSGDISLEETR